MRKRRRKRKKDESRGGIVRGGKEAGDSMEE